MTYFQTPSGEAPLDREVAHVRDLLLGLGDAVNALQGRLQQDEVQALAEAGAILADLRGLIRTAIETEKRFEKRRHQDRGHSSARHLELDTAWDAIGRRLDRLRAAADAGDVPQ